MQMSDVSLFAQFQNNRLFRLKASPEGLSELVLVDFQGTEGLSQLFDFHLRLASQDPNIELKQMIGQPVTISLQLTNALATSEHRYFHGYVTDFSQLDTDGGLATYSATVRPWLWMLSRRQDIRIFQEQTVQSILSKVFDEYGSLATYEFRLYKATANRSYCTQYRETDLNFALRLMQEEGLFFYFEHSKTGHKLIVTDSSTTAKPIDGFSASMPYSAGEILDDVDVITSYQAKRELMPGSIALKGADYKVPNARRYNTSKTDVDQGDVPSYEIYDYVGPQGFPDRDRGHELASLQSRGAGRTQQNLLRYEHEPPADAVALLPIGRSLRP
jgi:type VI secretion system secreted protein VgrG